MPVGAAVAEVGVSTYSNMAITVDGRVFTWGDSDGNALGHGNGHCHAPHWLTRCGPQHPLDMCYTRQPQP